MVTEIDQIWIWAKKNRLKLIFKERKRIQQKFEITKKWGKNYQKKSVVLLSLFLNKFWRQLINFHNFIEQKNISFNRTNWICSWFRCYPFHFSRWTNHCFFDTNLMSVVEKNYETVCRAHWFSVARAMTDMHQHVNTSNDTYIRMRQM